MHRQLGYVWMTGPDRHLDTTGDFDEPINSLPTKCAHCTFPDIDHVPQPYLLGRGIDRPAAIAPANLANFLVRDWPRRVIEATCAGQCEFFPTIDKKTKQTAPWSLAVPVHRIPVGLVRAEVPRCPVCGEPKTCHVNECDFDSTHTMAWDIAQSASWFGHEHTLGLEEDRERLRSILGPRFERMAADPGWARRGIYRLLFFSLRLELLLKKLKIKGMTRLAGDSGDPTKDDKAWVDEQIDQLRRLGLAEPSSDGTRESRGWLEGYLKKHGKRPRKARNFGSIEAALKVPLPPSYKAFVEQIGSKTFMNVDEREGFEARILLPEDLDLKSFRRGSVELGDEESRQIDGVLFAASGHGDGFCFDLAGTGPEYPVYLYDHELNTFEAYAPNFEGFLRRIAGKEG